MVRLQDVENGWATIEQAAKALGVSKSTLYRWHKDGRIRFYKFGPRTVRVRVSELEQLARAREGEGRAGPQPPDRPEPKRGVSLPPDAMNAVAERLIGAVTWDELFGAALRGLRATFSPVAGIFGGIVRGNQVWVIGIPDNWLWAGPDEREVLSWPYILALARRVQEKAPAVRITPDAVDLEKCWVLPFLGEHPLELRQAQPSRAFVTPVRTNEVSGAVAVGDPREELPAEEAQRMLQLWGTMLSQASNRIARLIEYENLALRDPLTGVNNRRAFSRRLEEEIAHTKRYRKPLSLLIIDLDGFKAFNDRYGHLAGDEVLRQVARWLEGNVRDTDMLARVGGDEFAVICPATDAEQARKLAERIVRGVSSLALPGGDRISASVGIAEALGAEASQRGLVARADAALYRAKRRGQQVSVYGAGTRPQAEVSRHEDSAEDSA